MAVSEEVDKELLAGATLAGADGGVELLGPHRGPAPRNRETRNGDNDDTMGRLAVMRCFAMGGLGLFKTRLGERAYNRVRKTTAPRQHAAGKGALRGAAIRAPVGK